MYLPCSTDVRFLPPSTLRPYPYSEIGAGIHLDDIAELWKPCHHYIDFHFPREMDVNVCAVFCCYSLLDVKVAVLVRCDDRRTVFITVKILYVHVMRVYSIDFYVK